ncbi:general secretion pathway protein GspB [Marinimicrobium sp. ARAG 43.8]|uniref:general secretion pathway protein GspB n=1 Tax=Marinimicrobium sp. ARAG 43.8 TaxID=3418719 RepID=UPI003CEA6C19
MSMILDALKQAEQERRQREQPAHSESGPNNEPGKREDTTPPSPAMPSSHRPPSDDAPPRRPAQKTGKLPLLLGAVTVALIGGGLALWAPRPESTAPTPKPNAEGMKSPTETVAPEPIEPSPAPQETARQETGPQETVSQETVAQETSPQAPAVDVAELYRSPQSDDAAAALYQQAGAEASSEEPLEEPEEERVTEPDAVAQEEPPPPVPTMPTIRDLSWGLQQRIPTLNYQAHDYRENGQSRVRINHREHRVGDQLAPGLRIEGIEEDGAVLSFEGETFKLPALNSWVNM